MGFNRKHMTAVFGKPLNLFNSASSGCLNLDNTAGSESGEFGGKGGLAITRSSFVVVELICLISRGIVSRLKL